MTDLPGALNVGILAVTLLTALLGVIPLITAAKRVLDGRQSAQDLELLRQVAMTSVRAVAQQYKTADNDKKLAAALELASTQLLAFGVRVDQVQLRAAIESAYLLAKASLELPPPPADDASSPAPVPAP